MELSSYARVAGSVALLLAFVTSCTQSETKIGSTEVAQSETKIGSTEVAQVEEGLAFGESMVVERPATRQGGVATWLLTVGAPRQMSDIYDDSDWIHKPIEGVTYLGIPVEMTLVSSDREPAAPRRDFSWSVIGGSSEGVYATMPVPGTAVGDAFCQPRSGNFNIESTRTEVLVGATISATVCVPVPTEDAADTRTKVSVSGADGEFFFRQGGAAAERVEAGVQGGPSTVDAMFATGLPAEFEMRHWSHDAPSLWEATISPLRDHSEDAAIIDPTMSPPDGITFAAFDVDLTRLAGTDESVLTVFDWEVQGGASKRSYAAGTFRSLSPCAFAQWDFDVELQVGDSTSGTMCIPVAVEDIGHPETVISLRFGDDERHSWAAN